MENHLEKYINNGKKNYVFGKGGVGQKIIFWLRKAIEISGIIVNDNYKDEEFFNGIPVFGVGEFNEEPEQCNIFIAVIRNRDEIIKSLKVKNECSLIFLDYNQDLTHLVKRHYLTYLENKGVDLSQENILVGNIKLKNPLFCKEGYGESWFMELGDCILPEAFSDYDYLDEGPYEYDRVEIFKEDIVFDCGANIGHFSAVAANKGCKVFAFEPAPDVRAYLKDIKNLYPENINIVPSALSDYVGDVNFDCTDKFSTGKIVTNINDNGEGRIIKVSQITLDQFVRENNISHVNFIKADLEGGERNMLRGAIEVLKTFEPKLSICTYHFEDDPEILEEIILSINPKYIINHSWKKLYAFVPRE